MWDYTDAVKEHFIHPKNVGEIENPDGVGNVGSISCGDALRLTIKVDRATEVITDAKFKTFGCASAIASSSMLTEMIIGMKLEDAEKLSNDDIARALGGLPKEKMHCSVMGREALEAAIADYRGVTLPMAQGQIVCECFGVTDLEIIRAIRENDLKSIEDITHFTKAGGGCGRCHERLQEILDRELHSEAASTAPPRSRRMTSLEKIRKIEAVIEQEIRPTLKRDHGDIQLIDVDGDRVTVALRGACVGCHASSATLKDYVEKRLREQVLDTLVVEEERA